MFKFLIRKFNKQGSFLIEVLLAVTILSVGLTSIIRSYLTSLRVLSYVQEYTTASFLLENMMTQFIQKGFVAADLNEKDFFRSPYENFSYHIRTKKAQGREGLENLNQITVVLSWGLDHRQRSLGASSYLFPLDEDAFPFTKK